MKPLENETAYRRAVDLARRLWTSRSHPGLDVKKDIAHAIDEVGSDQLIFALVDSVVLIACQAAEQSGADPEEYFLEVELQKTDRH